MFHDATDTNVKRATRFASNLCNFRPLGIRACQLRNNRFRPDKMGKVDGIFVETHLNDAILHFDNSRTCTRYLIKIDFFLRLKKAESFFRDSSRKKHGIVDNHMFRSADHFKNVYAK